MTDATEAAGGELVVTQEPDAVTTALTTTTSKYEQVVALVEKGKELAARYKDVVADVTTTKGYEQVALIRRELREEVRYPMQHLRDEISKTLGTLQRSTNKVIDAYIEVAERYEQPFDAMLAAEDARKEAERQRKAAEEQARKDGHAQAIAAITRMALEAVGLTSAELAQRLESARSIIVDESYEEFQGQALQAKDEAVRQLEGLRIAALADEEDRRDAEQARQRQAALAEQERAAREAAEQQAAAERERAAAAEAETAALREKMAAMERAEQERQQREEAARAERERAEQERAALIQARIDAVRTWGDDCKSSADILEAGERLHVLIDQIGPELYGDRVDEARTAAHVRHQELEELYAAAVEREQAEAAAAQRARREEMLATIVGMGDNAKLAVQDGSADVAQLQANLQVLLALDMSIELWGSEIVVAEARKAMDSCAELIRECIAATEERDRLAAEEAERIAREQAEAAEQRRQREAEEFAAMELAHAKSLHGEELYEVLRRIVLDPSQDAINEARALMKLINPEETFDA